MSSFYPKLARLAPSLNHLDPSVSQQSSKTPPGHCWFCFILPARPWDCAPPLNQTPETLDRTPSLNRETEATMPPWDPSHRLSILKQQRTSRDQFSHTPGSGQGASEFSKVTALVKALNVPFMTWSMGISHPDLARSLHPTGRLRT